MSALSHRGGNFIVTNSVQITDISELSDNDYYVLEHVGQGIYPSHNGTRMVSSTTYDYSSLVHLLYNKEKDVLHIKQVSTGTFYQGLQANTNLTLEKEPVEYTIDSPSTGVFRFINNNCYLHRNNGDPKGADKQYGGENSQWKIHKVEFRVPYQVDITEQITDLTKLPSEGYYILQGVGRGNYPCYPNDGGENIIVKNTYDQYSIVRLNYDEENNKIQFQQLYNGTDENRYYQDLTGGQLTIGPQPADFTVITPTGADDCFIFRNNNFNLHQNATNYPIGAGADATGDYSRWKIFKVKFAITLYDDIDIAALLTENAGKSFDFTLNRKVVNGYNTAVFPFYLNKDQITNIFGEGATVYTYSGTSESENQVIVSFNSTDTENGITANTPVLVKVEKESPENTFELSNVTFVKPKNEPCSEDKNEIIDFVGVYTPQTIAAGNYFVNGDLYKSSGNTTIKPFRAYLKVKEDMNQTNVKLMIGGTVTGIDSIDATAKSEGEAVYNLLGQRVSKAQKGIYIVNGKKVVVK